MFLTNFLHIIINTSGPINNAPIIEKMSETNLTLESGTLWTNLPKKMGELRESTSRHQ